MISETLFRVSQPMPAVAAPTTDTCPERCPCLIGHPWRCAPSRQAGASPPSDGRAEGSLDYLRAARSGIRPWDGPAGSLEYLRAARSGIRPWGGPAGSLGFLCAGRAG